MFTYQNDVKIISNTKIAKNYYLLQLEVPREFKDAVPGQFVHIKIGNLSEPLLRRPFSIHRLLPLKSKSKQKRFNLNILYEIKGKGTTLLSEKQSGEYLNVIGPLGNGFTMLDSRYSMLIGGGMGIAPLLFLAEKTRIQNPASRIQILIGAKTKTNILCEEEFKSFGCEVKIATEDGSRGFKGKVTDLIKTILQSAIYNLASVIYACGPEAMLTNLAKVCLIKKIPLQVSLEEFMGCGIGACLGCAIQTKEGFKRVCSDGPVFKAEEIAWKF